MKIVIETDERTVNSLRQRVLVRCMAGNEDIITYALHKILEALHEGKETVEWKLKKDID